MSWETIHPYLFQAFAFLFCAWVSLSLMTHMWFTHRRDSILKKLAWTFILCVPFIGWLFYCGMYTPLRENDVRAPVNADALAGPGSH